MKRIYPHEWMSRPIKKVALIGGARSRKHAPYRDVSWEIWGLGTKKHKLPRIDRWFEMHSKQQLINHYEITRGGRFKRHWTFLRKLKRPVYMIKSHRNIPNSVKYPLNAVINDVGRCFTSSVAYMLGLAIHEKFEGIGLWGINMASKNEYKHQLAGVQYLLALARHRGIEIYLPDDCPITIPDTPKPFVTDVLYGYDWDHPAAWWNHPKRKATFSKKAKKYAKKLAKKTKKNKGKHKNKSRSKLKPKSKTRKKRRDKKSSKRQSL